MFLKKMKTMPQLLDLKNTYGYDVVIMNNMIDICTDACSVCWDKQVPEDFERRCNYIETRIKTGHESVIEHSNFVLLLRFPASPANIMDLAMMLSWSQYGMRSRIEYVDGMCYVVYGGSIRAYKEMYRASTDLKNPIVALVTRAIYENCPKAFFYDFIQDGIFKDNLFVQLIENPCKPVQNTANDNLITVISEDMMRSAELYSLLEDIFGKDQTKNIWDEFATITILFKNMSRSCTHQTVRHRNAITQESQRYVDYAEAGFTNPTKYKEKYDQGATYRISALGGVEVNLDDLAKTLMTVYEDLREQGLDKEDARAYLPTNVQCKSLYMTFTYKHLFKFLSLRCDPHAQGEIREYANDIKAAALFIDEQIAFGILPEYKRKELDLYGYMKSIDEPIGEPVEITIPIEEPAKEVEYNGKDIL